MKKTVIQNRQFQSNFIWNLVGTTCNAVTSLFYMIIVTRLNGLETAGVFSFAFSNACVLIIIATYTGRTYQISEKKYSDRSFINVRICTCLIMFLIAMIMQQLFGDTVEKSIMLLTWCGVKMLEAFADVWYGVIQKNDRLDYVGKSLTLKSIASIGIFIFIDIIYKDVILASLSVLVINLVILSGYDYTKYRKYRMRIRKGNKQEFLAILNNGIFVFGINLLSTYLVNASKYAINNIGNDEAQAIYGIIIMPATAMTLVGHYLIQPFLVQLSELYMQKKAKEFQRILLKNSGILMIVGLIGVILVETIGIPILELIYNTALSVYKKELVMVILGAVCYAIFTLFMNALVIMHKNRIQFVDLLIIGVVVMFSAGKFVQFGSVTGAVILYMISMFVAVLTVGTITNCVLKKECRQDENSVHNNSSI